KTFEPIEKPNNFPPEFFGGEHHPAQNGIQARAITAARQHADTGLVHLRRRKGQRVFFGSTIRPPASHSSCSCQPRASSCAPSAKRFVLPSMTTIKWRGVTTVRSPCF